MPSPPVREEAPDVTCAQPIRVENHSANQILHRKSLFFSASPLLRVGPYGDAVLPLQDVVDYRVHVALVDELLRERRVQRRNKPARGCASHHTRGSGRARARLSVRTQASSSAASRSIRRRAPATIRARTRGRRRRRPGARRPRQLPRPRPTPSAVGARGRSRRAARAEAAGARSPGSQRASAEVRARMARARAAQRGGGVCGRAGYPRRVRSVRQHHLLQRV
jgi:hypothetical protein